MPPDYTGTPIATGMSRQVAIDRMNRLLNRNMSEPEIQIINNSLGGVGENVSEEQFNQAGRLINQQGSKFGLNFRPQYPNLTPMQTPQTGGIGPQPETLKKLMNNPSPINPEITQSSMQSISTPGGDMWGNLRQKRPGYV